VPDSTFPFHILIDASGTIIGVVLGQWEEKNPYSIYYINKILTHAELNYMVSEKEFLVVVHATNKFWHYIVGYQVFVHTYHSAIKYLMNTIVTNGRVTRWFLLLQEFDITIVDKPGKDNVVADFLSRLTNNGDDAPIEDYFPDEHFLAIYTHSSWYAVIVNYIAMRKLPHHLS
jgi:hypothetical protein